MSIIDKLVSQVDSSSTLSELVDLLCDLISIPTVNPPGENYREFCEHVRDVLSSWGIESELVKVPEEYVERFLPECREYPRYILRTGIGSGRPILHLNGHYDVVPPGSGWHVTEPFKPRVVNDRVYGRGSVDMKGGIAVCLMLLKLLREAESTISGRVELVLVPDEETGGATGTGYLVDVLKVRPDYVIVAEPSSSRRVLIGNKGALWLLVEVHGRQAHGATPWLGLNAFELGVKLAFHVMDPLKKLAESRVSMYEYDVEGGERATITFGGDVRSAGKVNVVPGYFAFSVDRRVIPEENLKQVEREIVEFIENKARELNINVSIKVLQRAPPATVSPESELVKKLDDAALEVLGSRLRKVVCTGGLDTRYYQLAGIQAVTYGPGDAACAHMADEFVEISELRDVLKVYLKVCEKLNIVQ